VEADATGDEALPRIRAWAASREGEGRDDWLIGHASVIGLRAVGYAGDRHADIEPGLLVADDSVDHEGMRDHRRINRVHGLAINVDGSAIHSLRLQEVVIDE